MREEIRCPKCGGKLEPINHSKVGASEEGRLPNADGPVTYVCQNPKCKHEFSEDDLKKIKGGSNA